MGNFDQYADNILLKSADNSAVSCFPILGVETGNILTNNGNLCRNFEHCKYRKSLITQGFIQETIEETSKKLVHALHETLIHHDNIKSFLVNKQVTVCIYAKICCLLNLIKAVSDLAGGDDPEFLAEIMLDTIKAYYDNLEVAIKCYFDIYNSMYKDGMKL